MPYWHPGETKVIQTYILNAGGMTDSYILSLTVDDSRWTGGLDHERFDDVPPGERRTFNVSITAPLWGKEGDRANVSLVATSVATNKTDQMRWIAFLIISHDVRLTCRNNTAAMLDGTTVRFDLTVANTGDVNDTYSIWENIAPSFPGWTTVLSMDKVSLARGENATITVDVTSPADSTLGVNVTVDAISLTQAEVRSSVVLHCQVISIWNVTLTPSNGTLVIDASTKDSHTLAIYQETNDAAQKDWSVRLYISDLSWTVTTEQADFHLFGTSSKMISIDIEPPPRSQPGNRTTLRVVVRCAQAPSTALEGMFLLEVGEVHNLSLNRIPSAQYSIAGGAFSFDFDVQNKGNVAQAFRVGLGLDDTWIVDYAMGGYVGPWFLLPPWEQATIKVVVHVPEDCHTHFIITELTLSSSEGVMAKFEMQYVIMISWAMFRLWPVSDQNLTFEAREQTVVVNFSIENKYNSTVSTTVFAETDNPGCNVTNNRSSVVLGALKMTVQGITLHIGKDAVFGPSTLRVSVRDAEGSQRLNFNLTIVGPDLEIVRAVPLESPVAGKVAAYNVTVRNVGQGRSDPTTIVVNCVGKWKVAGPVDIPGLPPGGKVDVKIGLVPFAGRLQYAFKVDPDATIREEGNASNELALWLEPAQARPAVGKLSWSDPLTAVAIVVLLAVSIATFTVLRRLRRRGPQP